MMHLRPSRECSLPARVGFVLLIGCLAGVLANTVSPNRIPWKQDWSMHVQQSAFEKGIRIAGLEDAHRIIKEGRHLVFDARPQDDYDAGHLPTAMSLPERDVDTYFEQYEMLLTPEQPLLVYCSGQECDESLVLAEFLINQGFTNVTLFVGGYTEWAAAEGEAL